METDSSHARLFTCPTCGAGLTPGEEPSIRCSYCGSSVLVPPEYRKVKPQPQEMPNLVIQVPASMPTRSANSALGIIIVVGVLFLVGIIVAASIFAATRATSMVSDVITSVESSINSTSPTQPGIDAIISTQLAGIPGIPTTPTGVPYAALTQEFGGKGSGPGRFEDPRSIAVDLEGNVYVAEYGAGRIQAFDPDGKFLYQINVEPSSADNLYISDLAVDYAGKLYAVRAGDILVYNTADGTPAATFSGTFPNTYFEALAITPDNQLVALHVSASSQDLIFLDTNGDVEQRLDEIMETIDKKAPALSLSLAVDGAGNIYIVNLMAEVVYKLDAQGNFLDRIGGGGDNPGEFTSPFGAAVDSQGRLYVVDFGDLEIFDANGRSLAQLAWNYQLGSARDVTIDSQDRVYVITTEGKVLQFTPNP